MQTNIDWNYSGKPDGFFGTGATKSERALVYIFGLAGTMLLVYHWYGLILPWAWWQYAIVLLFALDVIGGVVANSLNSCKRFYHAPLQPEETGLTALAKNPLVFSAFHVHTLMIGFLFGNMNWFYGIFWYALLIVSTLLILRSPLYLHRPLAVGIIMLAVLVNAYYVVPVAGFEWFVPALFLKIVYGHLVREEPYRA